MASEHSELFENNEAKKSILNSSSEIVPASIFVKDATGMTFVHFFYIDGHIDDANRDTVRLFGKVFDEIQNRWVSCCINVNNIHRRIYLEPRENVIKKDPTLSNLYDTWEAIAAKYCINKFLTKFVVKKCLYHEKYPGKMLPYVQVTYSHEYPIIKSFASFGACKNIYGHSATALERLLTEREIKGPCWLTITSPKFRLHDYKSCWCDVEIDCDGLMHISMNKKAKDTLRDPPIVATTINFTLSAFASTDDVNFMSDIIMIGLRTITNLKSDGNQSDDPHIEEIYLVSKPSDSSVNLTNDIKQKVSNAENAEIIFCQNDNILLKIFLKKLTYIQPDILLTFEDEYLLTVILHKLSEWEDGLFASQIGRLKNTPLKAYQRSLSKNKFELRRLLKRPICYLQEAIVEIQPKMRNNDMDMICNKILGTKCGEMKPIAPSKIPLMFKSEDHIISFINHIIFETQMISELANRMNILPLIFEMTTISGFVTSGILLFSRMDRSEYLLCHALAQENYIIPDIRSQNKDTESFQGGLSLEASIGLHNMITLLMDFRSLYPNIIREYNLCITTIIGVNSLTRTDVQLPGEDVPCGILPREIGKLVESRNEAKKKMKEAITQENILRYDIKQLGLKLVANSIFGCLGSCHCRFYTRNLAGIITAKGRSILTNTREIIENKGLAVLYGDTDSLMIDTDVVDYETALNISKDIMQEVNVQYKYIKLDLDAVYRYVLIHNRKVYHMLSMKKTPDGEVKLIHDSKGVRIKQSYSCPLVSEVLAFIKDQLFSDLSLDDKIVNIRAHLKSISEWTLEEDLDKIERHCTIKQKLFQDPDSTPMPTKWQMIAAIKYNNTVNEFDKLRAGDWIEYVIRRNKNAETLADCICPLCEEINKTNCPPDLKFYIFELLLPAFNEFCHTIPGLNAKFFLESLGLLNTYTNYKMKSYVQHNLPIQIELFTFKCGNCNNDIVMKQFWIRIKDNSYPYLEKCRQCGEERPSVYLKNLPATLESSMKRWLEKWSGTKIVMCRNDFCNNSSTDLTMLVNPQFCPKLHGNRYIEHFQAMLCEQFFHLKSIFDFDTQPKHLKETMSPDVIKTYRFFNNILDEAYDSWPIMQVHMDFNLAISKSIRLRPTVVEMKL